MPHTDDSESQVSVEIEQLCERVLSNPDVHEIRLTDVRFRWIREQRQVRIPMLAQTVADVFENARLAADPGTGKRRFPLMRQIAEYIRELESLTLEAELDSILTALLPRNSRDRQILLDRLGWEGAPPETLQTIGAKFDVSRERIRQIESRRLNPLPQMQIWTPALDRAISALDRYLPIPTKFVSQVLFSEGVTNTPEFSIESLFSAIETLGNSSKLNIEVFDTIEYLFYKDIPTHVDRLKSLEAVTKAASSIVSNQGIAHISEVSAAVSEKSVMPIEAMRLAIGLKPSLEVLSGDWIVPTDRSVRNPLRNRLEKLLAVYPGISIPLVVDQLARDAGRGDGRGYAATAEAIEVFTTWWSGAEIHDNQLYPKDSSQFELVGAERTVWNYLKKNPHATFPDVVEATMQHGNSRINIAKLLASSPVITRHGHRKSYTFTALSDTTLHPAGTRPEVTSHHLDELTSAPELTSNLDPAGGSQDTGVPEVPSETDTETASADTIESEGIRQSVVDIFLESHRGLGFMKLQDLEASIKAADADTTHKRIRFIDTAMLRNMMPRMSQLALVSDDTVIWIGSARKSILATRLIRAAEARQTESSTRSLWNSLRNERRFSDLSLTVIEDMSRLLPYLQKASENHEPESDMAIETLELESPDIGDDTVLHAEEAFLTLHGGAGLLGFDALFQCIYRNNPNEQITEIDVIRAIEREPNLTLLTKDLVAWIGEKRSSRILRDLMASVARHITPYNFSDIHADLERDGWTPRLTPELVELLYNAHVEATSSTMDSTSSRSPIDVEAVRKRSRLQTRLSVEPSVILGPSHAATVDTSATGLTTAHIWSIAEVLEMLETEQLMIPEIQRDYVWKPSAVRDLLDSLYRGFPIGMLLVSKSMSRYIARAAGGRQFRTVDHDTLQLLDGQQRMTSLRRVLETGELKVLFDPIAEKFETANVTNRNSSKRISVKDIYDLGADAILASRNFTNDEEVRQRLLRVQHIPERTLHVDVLEGFSYPDVQNLFERVNSKGTKLKGIDLTISNLALDIPGLVSDHLDTARERYAKRGWDIPNAMLLKLLTGVATGRGGPGDLRRVPTDKVRESWDQTVDAIDRWLNILDSNLLVRPVQSMLSVNSHVIPVYYLAHVDGTPQTRRLLEWFVHALIWKRYSGASGTAVNQDLTDLNPNAKNPFQPLMSRFHPGRSRQRIAASDISTTNVHSGPGAVSFLTSVHRNAVDLETGLPLSVLKDHPDWKATTSSLIPNRNLPAQLRSRLSREVANNIFLIHKDASSSAPRPDELGESRVQDLALLEPHAIHTPISIGSPIENRKFIEARRNNLAKAMNEYLDSLSD